MDTEVTDVTLDNALATWNALERHLGEFIAAWERGDEPAIAAHLPKTMSPVLRRLAMVEMVKADLDFRYSKGDKRLLEAYVAELPDLVDENGPPWDLIYEEFHVRRTHGDEVSREEYFQRFPGRRDELERFLGAVESSRTTSLMADRQLIELKEGDQIDDFDLLARLGAGTFGSVFLARQRSISRLVALKVSPDRGQEARMLAQLDHPNIVRVFDQRRMPDRKLRLVYMQFAPGGTLADLIERARVVPAHDRNGSIVVSVLEESGEQAGLAPQVDPSVLRAWQQLSWAEVVCRIGAQLAHALDYAHRQGVLHRDVKPANILLGGDGTPKLADFNISSLVSNPSVGAAAYFGGSLAYMSPEHLEAFNPKHARTAEELDGRADLFSLAVVLWELLCGQKPFRDTKVGDDWSETIEAMTARRRSLDMQPMAPPPGEMAQQVLTVLKRCLSPDVNERPTSGAELAQELNLCAQPRVRRLVMLPSRGWREWVRRAPIVAVLLIVTIPNALAGWFNYIYNKAEIIEFLRKQCFDDANKVFESVQMTINAIAFPLGAGLVFLFLWPVARQIRNPKRLTESSPEKLAALRKYALQLGHLAALIGIIEWIVAGVAYPVAIRLAAGQPLPTDAHWHFFVSLLLCGLVAAAYPFFGVTFLAVRVFFPALLQRGAVDLAAEAQLRRLGQQAGIYFMIACGVPLVGLMLLVMRGTEFRQVLMFLSVLSLVGLAIAFRTYRVILSDIEALSAVVRPADPFGIESSTKV